VGAGHLSEADQAHIAALQNKRVAGAAPNAEDAIDPVAFTTHEQLQQAAEKERFATSVIALYQAFVDNAAISVDERSKASQELEKWKSLASDKSLNYGGKWRTPAEVEELQKEAERLIEQAKSLVAVNNESLAINTLLRASKADPESVEADFTLGLLYALVGGHPEPARKQFVLCVRRLQELGELVDARQKANLVASLNNAAITEVRLGMESAALRHWEEAAEFDHIPPELIQNVGRFSSQAALGIHVAASRTLIDRIGTLYAELAASGQARPYDSTKGWFYVPHLGIAPTVDNSDANQGIQVP